MMFVDNKVSFKIALSDSSTQELFFSPDFGHFISVDGMNSIFPVFFHLWLLAADKKITDPPKLLGTTLRCTLVVKQYDRLIV